MPNFNMIPCIEKIIQKKEAKFYRKRVRESTQNVNPFNRHNFPQNGIFSEDSNYHNFGCSRDKLIIQTDLSSIK